MTASDEAKKALEGVTPGPWAWNTVGEFGPTSKEDDQSFGMICYPVGECQWPNTVDNARFIAWSREGVPALLAEIAAKDAEIARLRGEFIEATDENFIWGAMDNVHDADTTLDDYAAAVSRAQRAALARLKGGAA